MSGYCCWDGSTVMSGARHTCLLQVASKPSRKKASLTSPPADDDDDDDDDKSTLIASQHVTKCIPSVSRITRQSWIIFGVLC